MATSNMSIDQVKSALQQIASKGGPDAERAKRALEALSGDDGPARRPAKLPGAESRELAARMGIAANRGPSVRRNGASVVFGVMSPEEARRRRASMGAR